MKELIIKKCLKCGAVVEVLHDCTCADCGIKCCGEQMLTLKPNTMDAVFEKHVPNYEVQGDKILVSVNHVMEPNHFIEWVALVTETQVYKRVFNFNEKPEAVFPYVKNSKIYSFCNKHGLWEKDVI